MNNQTQITPTQQDLQGVTNPQTVRETSTIQSGVSTNNAADNSLYNNPSASVISVPNAGQIAPSQSQNTTVSEPTSSKTPNQLIMSGLLVCVIFAIFIFIIVIDRFKSNKFI